MSQSKSQDNRAESAEKKQLQADQEKRAKCGYSNNLLYKGDFIRCYCKHPDGITNMAVFENICPKSRSKRKQGLWAELVRQTRAAMEAA